ncbi:PAP2 superfamily domain-containing protein [Phthorimaea operculella]|nr:PAP2 superfamily domain-containing protein [Phthorimaea operculella]
MPLIRSASFNLFTEILIRIALFSAFCYMETMTPFIRMIPTASLESDYKYPRHESYVPGGMLWCVVLAVPCLLSLLAWAGCNDCNDALEILLAWSLALGINGCITDTVKLIAGRPRPDFFYRCFPDAVPTVGLIDTTTGALKCTGDENDIMEGRKSFPSGHSSLSFCSLGVASAWLCGRLGVLSRRRGSGARTLACLAPLIAATCIALSRSCDYHHHWQDILAGSILGYTTAIFCYRQYYNPLSSDLAGVPYVVSNVAMAKYANGVHDTSPSKERDENAPLLSGRKEDKWI